MRDAANAVHTNRGCQSLPANALGGIPGARRRLPPGGDGRQPRPVRHLPHLPIPLPPMSAMSRRYAARQATAAFVVTAIALLALDLFAN